MHGSVKKVTIDVDSRPIVIPNGKPLGSVYVCYDGYHVCKYYILESIDPIGFKHKGSYDSEWDIKYHVGTYSLTISEIHFEKRNGSKIHKRDTYGCEVCL